MISSIRVKNKSQRATRIVGTSVIIQPGVTIDLLGLFSISDLAGLYDLPAMIDADQIQVVFVKDNAASNCNDGATFTSLIQFEIGGGGSGGAPGVGFTVNAMYVDGAKGNDTTGDGTSAKPFRTIQRACNKIGDAKNAGEFNDPTTNEWMIVIAAGIYAENVALPVRQTVQLGMEAVTINGNVSQVVPPMKFYGGLINESKVVLKGISTEDAGPDVPPSQINGTVLIHSAGPMRCAVHAHHSTINGDVNFESGARPYEGKLCLVHTDILGAVLATGGGTVKVYSATKEDLAPSEIGGVVGNVDLDTLSNVVFTGQVQTSSPSGGKWTSVFFTENLQHDFSEASGNFVCDTSSADSFSRNVPHKGAIVITLQENAARIAYTPNKPGHWKEQPTTTRDALDQLARRVNKIGG